MDEIRERQFTNMETKFVNEHREKCLLIGINVNLNNHNILCLSVKEVFT